MKRILVLVILLSAIVVLSGCVENNEKSPTETTAPIPTPPVTPERIIITGNSQIQDVSGDIIIVSGNLNTPSN
jgi:hypothetical protein